MHIILTIIKWAINLGCFIMVWFVYMLLMRVSIKTMWPNTVLYYSMHPLICLRINGYIYIYIYIYICSGNKFATPIDEKALKPL